MVIIPIFGYLTTPIQMPSLCSIQYSENVIMKNECVWTLNREQYPQLTKMITAYLQKLIMADNTCGKNDYTVSHR